MGVDLYDLLDGGGLHERAGDPLLHRQDDALGRLDADGRGAKLDRLDGVLHLGGNRVLWWRFGGLSREERREITRRAQKSAERAQREQESTERAQKFTWKSLPSGEKVFGPRSYSDLFRNMLESRGLVDGGRQEKVKSERINI